MGIHECLGDLLRIHTPWLLLETLLRVGSAVPLRTACQVINSTPENNLLECYLEGCVRQNFASPAAGLFADVLLRRAKHSLEYGDTVVADMLLLAEAGLPDWTNTLTFKLLVKLVCGIELFTVCNICRGH